MSKTISNTENTQKQEPYTEFTREIAFWLESFNGFFELNPKTQKLLHDSIMCMDDQCFNDEEKKVVTDHLSSVLSLSFIITNNGENLDKFVKYHR